MQHRWSFWLGVKWGFHCLHLPLCWLLSRNNQSIGAVRRPFFCGLRYAALAVAKEYVSLSECDFCLGEFVGRGHAGMDWSWDHGTFGCFWTKNHWAQQLFPIFLEMPFNTFEIVQSNLFLFPIASVCSEGREKVLTTLCDASLRPQSSVSLALEKRVVQHHQAIAVAVG